MGRGSKSYLVMFKRAGIKDPDPAMSDGWFSMKIEAQDKQVAERWAKYRVGMLAPWLRFDLEMVRCELYKPTPELAGPYRGLAISMD